MTTRNDGPAFARGLSRYDEWLIQPDGFVSGPAAAALVAAGKAVPIAGDRRAFTAVRLHPPGTIAAEPDTRPVTIAVPDLSDRLAERLAPFAGALPSFAGLEPGVTRVMGIVNVTPDSFSDGGAFLQFEAAVAHGQALAAAGAEILDVGGESTRPGAEPVPVEEELRRVVPVVEHLVRATGAIISVDTRRAPVMRAAVAAGARIVNDITALSGEPDSLEAVAATDASVVLMHMQGEPQTMQRAPHYDHAPSEVFDYLAARVDACIAAGIARERIAVDPGIGFGKTVDHNLELIEALPMLRGLGCTVLLGVSRKGFIGRLGGGAAPEERAAASVATALRGIDRGADIVRVHDVADTVRALSLWNAFHPPFR